VDKYTEEEALVTKCIDEVKSQYVDWYNLGYQTCMAEKKEWIGLTDEEAAECWSTSAVASWKNIEDKLREKNGG
jgi:hypothetical protein